MSKKNCLTCKYEPKWGQETKGNYPRVTGLCKWESKIEVTPKCFRIVIDPIVRYIRDDSGIHENCRAWQPKD